MRYLILFLLLLLLVGCQAAANEPVADAVSPVQVALVSGDFAVGRPRVSFALFDGPEPLANVEKVDLSVVEVGAENATPMWTGTAEGYSDYEVPYWVAYPELPAAGFWGLAAAITLDDGTGVEASFVVEVREESAAPAVGEAAPASENRTLESEPDLQKLSSGSDPNPALYQMTVAEAIASGRPTVVGFITPGLCQTEWCAPVLDSVEAVRADVGEQANFIHVEVYEDFQALTVVDEMAEWGLTTEPWVFVLDEDGRVVARFNGPLSARELMGALGPLL